MRNGEWAMEEIWEDPHQGKDTCFCLFTPPAPLWGRAVSFSIEKLGRRGAGGRGEGGEKRF
ncbi:MAG TPA: hypothetical protein DEP38_01870 [Cyanobacteria bacterium UBA9226]|nr:hypothetical protein [Cyanobacteria bacterium UBA9226]